MKEPPSGNNQLKPLYILLGSMVAIFVLGRMFGHKWLINYIALSNPAIITGKFWTFITYSFLHGGTFHLLINCFILFSIGRFLIQYMGIQRFFTLYFLGVIIGGISWFLVNGHKGLPYPLVGASAGITGMILVFARIQPNAKFLLFFIIPVTAKKIIYALLIFDGLGLLFTELLPYGSQGFGIAHSAHLGGFLAGWLFLKFLMNKDFTFGTADITPPKWFGKKSSPKKGFGGFTVNRTNRKELEEEVNRILDKINSKGFGALTQDEKNTLDRAKDKLGK